MPEKTVSCGELVGQSAAMVPVFEAIRSVADTEVPVLIAGETGTGKDLVARAVWQHSARRGKPFLAVNTGALSRELIASELFGHVKGAFTGAEAPKEGRFAEADGGTLFLDEVATMEERLQVALLRVLEQGKFRPVGAKHDRAVDVRLIAASNTNLREAVAEGTFREDLLHRLEVFRIVVPPLRDRLEDLPFLVEHFVRQTQEEYGLDPFAVSPEAMAVLAAYPWPGNVRELKNVLAQAAVMAQEGVVEVRHLPPRVRTRPGQTEDSAESVPAAPLPIEEPALGETPATAVAEAVPHEPPAMALDPPSMPLTGGTAPGVFIPLGLSLEEAQKAFILFTLEANNNNKTQAAKALGINRKTLHDKLSRWKRKTETDASSA